jgi:hypothetical protein
MHRVYAPDINEGTPAGRCSAAQFSSVQCSAAQAQGCAMQRNAVPGEHVPPGMVRALWCRPTSGRAPSWGLQRWRAPRCPACSATRTGTAVLLEAPMCCAVTRNCSQLARCWWVRCVRRVPAALAPGRPPGGQRWCFRPPRRPTGTGRRCICGSQHTPGLMAASTGRRCSGKRRTPVAQAACC